MPKSAFGDMEVTHWRIEKCLVALGDFDIIN